MEEKQVLTGVVRVWGPLADAGPMGLGAFALTTFMSAIHNAGWAPDYVWLCLALFYGGATQFIAGMFEFSRNQVFSATVFTTYGAFWLSYALYHMLYILPGATFMMPQNTPAQVDVVLNGIAWFISGFLLFNTVYCVCALQMNTAIMVVMLLLEMTLTLVMTGHFLGQEAGEGVTAAGGYFGFFCSAAAFYAMTALCFNNMAGRVVMPVGEPIVNYWKTSSKQMLAAAEGPAAEPLTDTPVIGE